MEESSVVRIISPTATLKNIKPGETVTIPISDISRPVLRATANKLRRQGLMFSTHQTGDKLEVTRLK